MEIVKSLSEGKVILSLNGKLSAASAGKFNAAVEEALGESPALVLDFKDVDYMASAGLRVLVAAQKKLHTSGDSLILFNVRKEVMEVFEVTGLDEVFDIR
ncbi:MAG: STAS domain-containing protein [Spirochaetaceae bacterium]|jgi:anti-sigma B factor antagonist|nr:STAS domain-containing protein [Spirochaetaceae bacterium]